jgi:hypothetical protein
VLPLPEFGTIPTTVGVPAELAYCVIDDPELLDAVVMESVMERLAPEFAATEYATVALPTPLEGEVTVNQAAPEERLQEQPAPVRI